MNIKFSKNIIRNSTLEVCLDNHESNFIINQFQKNSGEIYYVNDNRIVRKEIQDYAESDSEIERIKESLIKLQKLFYNKVSYDGKVMLIISKYITIKELYEADNLRQKDVKCYFVFSFVIYENKKPVLSRYVVNREINIDLFLKELLSDFNYLKLFKQNYLFSQVDTIMFSQRAASKLFHELIGHLLEIDHFAISPLRNQIGHKVFNTELNLYENFDVDIMYDDLGNIIKHNVALIENGVITNLLSYTDNMYGFFAINSGNAVINKYNELIIPRMRSMKIMSNKSHSSDDFSNYSGLFIEDFDTGEINPTEGVITFTVYKAFIKKNGENIKPLNRFTFYMNIMELIKKEIIFADNYQEEINFCIKSGQTTFTRCNCPEIIVR